MLGSTYANIFISSPGWFFWASDSERAVFAGMHEAAGLDFILQVELHIIT